MPDIIINQQGVLSLLQRLNVNKASGPDLISPRIMKELATAIAPVLTSIFKKSLEHGEIPSDWKKAHVTPVYKKGRKTDPCNSITCISCKLLERIIVSNINQHASNNDILYHSQHGFRAKRSCETQLIEFADDLAQNTQRGGQTDVLVMDFSKAFDKVSHQRLLLKLDHYGIRGKTKEWIKAFLTERSQRVMLSGEISDSTLVLSGVPQGSVLGPVLFLFYINDLPQSLQSNVRLFADDTLLYLTIH